MINQTDIKTYLILALMLSTLLGVAGAAQEVKEYTIVKGDTLWDISQKELQDPFLWPKVWKENPDIKNPDRVYPGQSIRIPLYLLEKERPEEVASEPVAPTEKRAAPVVETEKNDTKGVALKPLIDRDLLIASGYVAESLQKMGTITGSPDDRKAFGVRDYVYVQPTHQVKIGDLFYVVRAENPVRHPKTDKFMGYMVEVLGIAEIKEFLYGETKAQIIRDFFEIVQGDILVPYEELVPPLTAGQHRRPAIDATVIAARGLQQLNGNLDIVYIDKGRRDGIEIGDLFRTVSLGSHKVPNGIIQVISHRESTATAVVREFSDTVAPGNWVTQLVEKRAP